ncbi:hypothetical protein ACRRGW_002209, partial [Escherichia coli]
RDVETARHFTFFRIIANEDKKTGFPRFQSDDKRQNCLMRYAYQAYISLQYVHYFVGRIRRSRRIRHEQSAICQQ